VAGATAHTDEKQANAALAHGRRSRVDRGRDLADRLEVGVSVVVRLHPEEAVGGEYRRGASR
jgi:hypothetical protein